MIQLQNVFQKSFNFLISCVIYTSFSLTSPDSAENFSFHAVHSVCSNLESSNCKYTKTGEYFVDQNIKNSRCVGGYSKVNSCDSRDMVLADSFSTGRMGSNIYKFNGAVIGSNFLTGIQKLMAIKSLISALFLLITALVLPKKLQRAFICSHDPRKYHASRINCSNRALKDFLLHDLSFSLLSI